MSTALKIGTSDDGNQNIAIKISASTGVARILVMNGDSAALIFGETALDNPVTKPNAMLRKKASRTLKKELEIARQKALEPIKRTSEIATNSGPGRIRMLCIDSEATFQMARNAAIPRLLQRNG
jgi:hypothetical protein